MFKSGGIKHFPVPFLEHQVNPESVVGGFFVHWGRPEGPSSKRIRKRIRLRIHFYFLWRNVFVWDKTCFQMENRCGKVVEILDMEATQCHAILCNTLLNFSTRCHPPVYQSVLWHDTIWVLHAGCHTILDDAIECPSLSLFNSASTGTDDAIYPNNFPGTTGVFNL